MGKDAIRHFYRRNELPLHQQHHGFSVGAPQPQPPNLDSRNDMLGRRLLSSPENLINHLTATSLTKKIQQIKKSKKVD